MRRGIAGLGLVAYLAAVACGCGARSAPPAAIPPEPTQDTPAAAADRETPAACALIAEAGEPITAVALADRIDPANAPQPSNDSERLLFRQLYETLVRVDCEGRVRPALAASWRLDPGGRTWMITLRDRARFADGTPVTAAGVVSSWSRGGTGGEELRPDVRRVVDSVVPAGDGTLAITLRNQNAIAPVALADTHLAVARRVPGSVWLLGTRGARVAPDSGTPDRNGRWIVTLTGPASGAAPPDPGSAARSIRFVVAPDRDRRDFLDEGIDLLLTRDPAAIDYAATLPQFLSVPLAWHRIHVFLSPGRGSEQTLSPDARRTLAGDALRGEARGAEGPFWWQAEPACAAARRAPRGRPSAPGRIVYERGDDASRELAERFVGLASVPVQEAAAILGALLPGVDRRLLQRAIGLTSQEMRSAEQAGADIGYVVSLDRIAFDPCQAQQALVDRAPWLDLETIVPLVDTRLRAIARRGRSGVAVEWDGGLLIAGPGVER